MKGKRPLLYQKENSTTQKTQTKEETKGKYQPHPLTHKTAQPNPAQPKQVHPLTLTTPAPGAYRNSLNPAQTLSEAWEVPAATGPGPSAHILSQ
jgi:hypothetical protein